MRTATACLLALAALSVKCSSYIPPSTPAAVVPAVEIAAPPQRVWSGLLRYVNEYDIQTETLDEKDFLLRTRPIGLTDTHGGLTIVEDVQTVRNQWCDCGTVKLGNVFGSETQISEVLTVLLLPAASGHTKAQVHAFFTGVSVGKKHLRTAENDVVLNLTCVSTGAREGEIIEYLRNAVAGNP